VLIVDGLGMDVDEDETVTKCWECKQELSNAKCLPCSHTFCCSCLESLCRRTIPGGQQLCPRCKQGFRVPTNGCRAFPDNPLVLPVQRLRQAVVSTRAAVHHLDELNRTLEAHNIEAGSK